MEGQTENVAFTACLFSFGAALVVLAIANVVMSAAYLVAHGLSYMDYSTWSPGIIVGAFFLSFVGFLFMSIARGLTRSHSSDRAEKAQ